MSSSITNTKKNIVVFCLMHYTSVIQLLCSARYRFLTNADGETMEEKTKDSQCCTISKYWPCMEKMWKTVSVGQFFRYWPYMEKMSKETANKQYQTIQPYVEKI